MDVKDILAGVPARVQNNPKSVFSETFLLSDLPDFREQMADKIQLVFRDILQRSVVSFGNDQGVYGCLRVDVIEGEDALVIVDDLAGDLSVDDLAEDTVTHELTPGIVRYGLREH
jgi:hypothetical protein